MIDNMYNNPDVINEEYLKFQAKESERKALRGRSISTGLLCIICLSVFSVAAVILSSIITGALDGTPMLTDDKLSLIPDMLLNALVSLIGMGVVGVIFCKATKTDLNDIFPSERMSFKKFAAVVAVGLTVSLSANYIAQIFLIDLSIFGLETMYEDMLTGSTSFIEHIAYILAVSVVPAVAEELVYRGCVMGRLRKYGDGFALIVSAILFGMMHGNLLQAPFAFVVGIALGWAVIYTNSIFPAMIIHGLNNLLSVIADIAYENLEAAGFETFYVDFVYMGLYAFLFIAAILAIYKFSKNDKNFLMLKPYEGLLTFKERIKTFFTSATVIIFLAITLLECLVTLKVID